MERLTHKSKVRKGGYIFNEDIEPMQCIDRLGEYEDTGLTPEQIKEMDRLYAEKCRKVAEYQKMLGEAAGVKETENGR